MTGNFRYGMHLCLLVALACKPGYGILSIVSGAFVFVITPALFISVSVIDSFNPEDLIGRSKFAVAVTVSSLGVQ